MFSARPLTCLFYCNAIFHDRQRIVNRPTKHQAHDKPVTLCNYWEISVKSMI